MSYEDQLGWIVAQLREIQDRVDDARAVLQQAERDLQAMQDHLNGLRNHMREHT